MHSVDSSGRTGNHGSLLARSTLTSVPSQAPDPGKVVLPHTAITVLGTRFQVVTFTDLPSIRMTSGSVHVERLSDGATVDLDTGQWLRVPAVGPLTPHSAPRVAIVHGAQEQGQHRQQLQDHLLRQGFDAQARPWETFRQADITTAEVVLLMDSLIAKDKDFSQLGNWPIGFVSLETFLWKDIGIARSDPEYRGGFHRLTPAERSGLDSLVITRPDHPLAADLVGEVDLFRHGGLVMNHGQIPADRIIAHRPGQPQQAVLAFGRTPTGQRSVGLAVATTAEIPGVFSPAGLRLLRQAPIWAAGKE